MAKVTGDQPVLLLVGSIDVFFSIVLIMLGTQSVLLFNHGAVGIPMWTGILLLMVGLGNIIVALRSSKRRNNRDYLSINFVSLLLNLTGLILAALLIGFYTWGAWDALQIGATAVTSIYSTVILIAVVIFIMSLMAMFMDCCSYALFSDRRENYMPSSRVRGAMYDDTPYALRPPPAPMYRP